MQFLDSSTLKNTWDAEDVYVDADLFFNNVIDAIGVAKQSIELEAYIFDKDNLGSRILTALVNAAKRGVIVRVMLDGIGTRGWQHTITSTLAKAGIEYKLYHPFPWSDKSSRLSQFIGSLSWIYKLNKRIHRKVFIIDHELAWISSMNISDVHLHSIMGDRAWRDTGVKVAGRDIEVLVAAFDRLWFAGVKAARQQRRIAGRLIRNSARSAVRLNANRKLRRLHYKNFLSRIRNAQRIVYITTPYFVPTAPLLRALKAAAHRGVKVAILLPDESDVFFMPWVAAAFDYSLMKAGARIYHYTPSILHAKTSLIDDWAIIGTSNLNYRSLIHDLEVDIVITHPQNRLLLEQQFLNDIEHSKLLTKNNFGLWYLTKRTIGKLLVYFKRWL